MNEIGEIKKHAVELDVKRFRSLSTRDFENGAVKDALYFAVRDRQLLLNELEDLQKELCPTMERQSCDGCSLMGTTK